MEKHIQFAKDIIRCLAGIEFEVIQNTSDALLQYLNGTMDGLLLKLPSMTDRASIHQLLQPNCIYNLRASIGLQYFVFLNQPKNQLILLGPSLMESYTEANARQQLHSFHLSEKTVERLVNRYSTLPILPMRTLHRVSLLLVQQLTNNSSSISHQAVDLILDQSHPHQALPHDEVPQMRRVETRYEISSALTEAVKQGNLSLALSLLSGYGSGLETDIRNTNPLRNIQNYCIVLNTQLRHALETNGIHPYRLDKLSNEIGIQIENMRSVNETQDFVFLIIQKYCQLEQENAYPNLNPLVHLAVTYIKEHLNEDLSVKETAQILGVNANYLSSQFHKNMGLTFIDFVHRERTNQATALLKHTNLQIQQIASIVGYNNTSYFAKQFLRFQGSNPGQYRKGGIL